MANQLPPPPTVDPSGSYAWLEWFRQLRNYISSAGSVPWSVIDFAGSTISDIVNRSHQLLQSLQGGTAGQYYHLTQSKHGEVNSNLDLSGTSGTGLKVDLTTPTFGWRDLEGPIQPKASGAGSPTWTTYTGNIKEWKFVANDIVDLKFHWPHDHVPGTDVYIHIHWTHNGSNISGSATVDYRYIWGKRDGAYEAEKTLSQTITTTNITSRPTLTTFVDEIQLSASSPSASQIDTDNFEPDGLLKMSVKVNTIPTITAGDFFIEYIDIHYQSSNLGTKNKAANFYV